MEKLEIKTQTVKFLKIPLLTLKLGQGISFDMSLDYLLTKNTVMY